jgi:predicted aspartyl protease
MEIIIVPVTIENALDKSKRLTCDALVDTGASFVVLPAAWKKRLGDLELLRDVEVEVATQDTVQGSIYGPVRIQISGFKPIVSEVLFLDMTPTNGEYQPLIGYIALEQSQAAVDMIGHRLTHVKHMYLK